MYKLFKKPQNPKIITGFPGFGLVGTIATEFLIEHLQTESIGKMWLEEGPAVVAVHNEKIIDPIGIFYNQKHNIMVVHGLSAGQGMEWALADEIMRLADEVDASELIPLEGVASVQANDNPQVFFHATHDDKKAKFTQIGLQPMQEGIIMGVTSALMVKLDKPLSSLFVESHADLPDSKAAARLVAALDKYLSLGVDEKPLLETAEKFEQKLKGLLEKSRTAQDQKEKKMMSYVG
ncbi:MAG: hypothetical protein QS98_C0008G0024 [archaeon GW2011_AR3]|nr:MAG: hypothetical protein QS98_C0008G0024 [archaeon GW2011_AR3]